MSQIASVSPKTFTTPAGPIYAEVTEAGGVLQINVPVLPGKDFGLFAVYDILEDFEDDFARFVERDLAYTGPDENLTLALQDCVAAGTGPARKFTVTRTGAAK